jgi:hypothetical protein
MIKLAIALTVIFATDAFGGLFKHRYTKTAKIGLILVEVPLAIERIKDQSFFADVINHCKDPSLDFDCKKTNCHESIHSINADLRITYSNKLKKTMNGFYLGNGNAVILEEPNMKKSKIAEFIPEKLRYNRFNLYIQEMQSMEDTPLYIFDEWVAYIGGGKAAFEEETPWSDSVFGCLEFSVFSTALAMAVEKYDPNYWKTNQQFRYFIISQLKSSHEIYMKAKKLNKFQWDRQDEMLSNLRNAKEAALMRNFMRKNLSNVWLD